MRNSDDADRLHFRSDRITCQNGVFYFSTREGSLEGPYVSREQAEAAAALYIRYHLDPTRLDSSHQQPDGHIYRYMERAGKDRREDDRRAGERRKKDLLMK